MNAHELSVPVFILAVLAIAPMWYFFHFFFTWLHKRYSSRVMLALSLLMFLIITISLTAAGKHIGDMYPSISSAGACHGGRYGCNMPIDINLMWLEFFLASLGAWAGFLSGFMKWKVINW